MFKVIEVGSWNGAGMENPVSLIKISSQGLGWYDTKQLLKQASHEFVDKCRHLKLASGEIPIHLNAIGATEGYGPNRNGDGFFERTCREVHPSFVKRARYYMNHKNKDPLQSYGAVKLSMYNAPMRRIELLVFGNATKEAADRNGQLQMKQATVDKLNRGELVPFSMACTLPYDVCQNCFNKAANRSLYCTEDTCINPHTGRRGFGCADGLTKVSADGFQQFVDNPNSQMFDISEVIRQADYIASGGMADYMSKAAAAGHTLGGAELAECWQRQGANFDLLSPEQTVFNQHVQQQIKLAQLLAGEEERLEAGGASVALGYIRGLANTPVMPCDQIGKIGSTQLPDRLKAMAIHKIAMPLETFLQIVCAEQPEKVAEFMQTVPQHLPGVFGRLVADPKLELMLKSNMFSPLEGLPTKTARDWAEKHASTYSVDPSDVQNRLFSAVLHRAPTGKLIAKSAMVKTASADDMSERLARQYAVYKIATLAAMPEAAQADRTVRALLVQQNYVSKT